MSQVNFSNVGLGEVLQNPEILYQIGAREEREDPNQPAEGVIPEIARAFEYPLTEQPNAENMDGLVKLTGQKSTLRDNETQVESVLGESAAPTTHDWVVRSGIMEPLNRGLWRPDQETPEDAVLVVMGGVPRWVARSIQSAVASPQTEVVIAAGGKVMDSEMDLQNDTVKAFHKEHKRYPTQSEHVAALHGPELEEAGKHVRVANAPAEKGRDVLAEMFRQYPDLLERKVAAVRVANAALMMALQLRVAAHAVLGTSSTFDTRKAPQVYAMCGPFDLAANKADAKNPAKFQSPITALRQIPVTAKLFLHQQV